MNCIVFFVFQGRGLQATLPTRQSQLHTNPADTRTAFQTRIPAGIILRRRLHPLLPPPPPLLTTAATIITTHPTASSLMEAVAPPSPPAVAGISASHPPQKDGLPLPPTAPTNERTLASIPDRGSAPSGTRRFLPPPLLRSPRPPLPPSPPPPLPHPWQQLQREPSSKTVTVLLSQVLSISQPPVFSIHLTRPLQSPSPYRLKSIPWTRTTDCSPPRKPLLPTPCLPRNFLLRKQRRISAQQ